MLQVDDANDQTIASLLKDSVLPDGFTVFNTKKMPGQGTTTLSCNLQVHVIFEHMNDVFCSDEYKFSIKFLFVCKSQRILSLPYDFHYSDVLLIT